MRYHAPTRDLYAILNHISIGKIRIYFKKEFFASNIFYLMYIIYYINKILGLKNI